MSRQNDLLAMATAVLRQCQKMSSPPSPAERAEVLGLIQTLLHRATYRDDCEDMLGKCHNMIDKLLYLMPQIRPALHEARVPIYERCLDEIRQMKHELQ